MLPFLRFIFVVFTLDIFQENNAQMVTQLKNCCNIGSNWAKENLRCEKYAGPVPGVPRIQQSLCLEAVDICCNRAWNEKRCDVGKKAARDGEACAESSSTNSKGSWNNHQRDCCEGCKLGILTGSLGQGCALTGFSFGNPWDAAFLECCDVALTSTTSISTSLESKTSSVTATTDTSPENPSSTISNSSLISLSTIMTTPSNDSSNFFNSSTLSSSASSLSTKAASTDENETTIPTPSLDDICQLLKGMLCSHICVPTPGSYYCDCPPGYVLLEDDKTCRTDGPINRCESDNPCEHRCVDTGTDVKCECDPGFQLAKDGHSCELKSTTTSTTLSTTKSVKPKDNKDKKKPRCPPGYKFNATAHVCDDIDECQEYPCPVTNTCENVVGSYVCIPESGAISTVMHREMIKNQRDGREDCPPGYDWDGQLESCVDIDECIELAESPCLINSHLCVNTQGSFACHEMTASKDCPAGFKLNVTTKTCQDVDECAEGLHGCLALVEACRNTQGAYECDVQCRKGFSFSRSLGICVDVNECEEIEGPCPRTRSDCINTAGSYLCQKPRLKTLEFNEKEEEEEEAEEERVENDFEKNELVDDNVFEATRDFIERRISHVNHSDIRKTRLIPTLSSSLLTLPSSSFSSSLSTSRSSTFSKSSALNTYPCELGYTYVNNSCIDVNECTEGPGCQDHERCINRPGGYDCSPLCSTGWYFNPSTKQCQDVNECLLGRHNCSENTQICKNVNGSYICEEIVPCLAGFHRAANRSCVDIDECADKTHSCSATLHQYCVNREGTYDCVTRLPDCMDGYRYSLASQRCEDIDECVIRFPCDSRLSERCVNLPGSYKCERPMRSFQFRRPACPTGYRYDSKTRQCEDVDECIERQNLCSDKEICYNQPGGYSCSKIPAPLPEPTQEETEPTSQTTPIDKKCGNGMKFMKNRGCVDIDECEEIEDACSSNEECINSIGNFTCNCRIGFRRDNLTQACVDINECQLQNDCLPSQRCDNTLGSYNCVRFLPCGTGYTLNAATEICEDDDECILGTHDCSDGYHCRNTLGSYRCDRNPRNQVAIKTTVSPVTQLTTVPTTSAKPITTTVAVPTIGSRIGNTQTQNGQSEPEISEPCPAGFDQMPNGGCIDIDECQRPNICRSQIQRCINTQGSYRCVSRVICARGWKFDPETSRCIDVDECAEDIHECGAEQTCENRQGSYVCACPTGYVVGPNKDCIDVDECSVYSGRVCGSNGRCVNNPGSYQCVCNEGFEKSTQGTVCQDINECENHPEICQQGCVNLWGSYRCTCRPGFRISADNKFCKDVDECEEFKENNLCVGICENTPGSYSCSCPDGYRLGIDGRTCQDIDECATGRACRDPDETCQNTRGGFRCNRINCPPGYHLDTHRRNRCVRSSRYCPANDLACFRQPSHYSYNFITFVSLFPLPPTGQLELFTMRGTHLPGSVMRFSMALVDVRAPPTVTRATESCFALRRPSPSQAVLVLTRSIPGPQEIELNLSMEIYHNTAFAGSAVAKILIIVTQYEF